MKTIEEKNRMIAVFMGYEDRCRFIPPRNVVEKQVKGSVYKIFKYEDLKYHLEWNWIMPVVREIIRICCNEDEEAFMSDQYTSILDVVPIAMIEETYKVVVEFIEWYNEKKKNGKF